MDYAINNYRTRKIGDKYFVTTDHGSYCILSEDEFKRLHQDNIDKELAERLKEKEIILDETNINEAVRLTKNRNDFLFSGTSLHIIVVTLRCNMNCIYCHASSKSAKEMKYDMDKETARNTVDFIFQSPSRDIRIEFQGGEPMLNWDIVKYINEYAQEKNKQVGKNLKITIVTNFTEMDDDKLDYLIKNEIDICTSLDGPKEVHDYNRPYVGGSNYEQVIRGIKKVMAEYKKRNIKNRKAHALVTLTKKSLAYPKEIVDEYMKLGLNDIHLRFLNNLGIAQKAWPKINYDVKEYLDFWKKAVEYIDELKGQGKNIGERMVLLITKKINEEYDPNYLDLRSPCGAAIGQLAYNFNGEIYTCDEARMIGEDLFLIGNVKEDQYKDVVTCKKSCAVVNASINDMYVCNECAYKPYCGICPVCNYAEQGNVIGKITETGRCKIYKAQFDWVVKNKFMKQKE